MSRVTLNLTPELYEYLLSVSLREPAVLKRLRQETANLQQGNMQISPEQGQFMQWLVALMGAQQVLEVGTFTGYSALSMALALPEDGVIECCDISREWTDIARRYWDEAGQSDKIRLHLGPALETLQSLLQQGRQQSFDIAFIDANKTDYGSYYEYCLQLLRPGGVLIIDNTLWGGSVIDLHDDSEDTRAIRRLNQTVYEDMRVAVSLLPIGDGLTLVRKL